MRRGEVFWAALSPRSGSEQRGRRPVILVSHDAFNLSPGWRSINVVPLSRSGAQARRGPTTVALPAGSGGLTKRSEEHTSELQSRLHLVCRLLLEKKNHPLHVTPPART